MSRAVRICATPLLVLMLSILSLGQGNVSSAEWKAIHEKDIAKWSNKTNLATVQVRALLAVTEGEEADDSQYLIENIDRTTLAKRHHILVSTQRFGTGHCMEVHIVEEKHGVYRQVWYASSIAGISNLCSESLLGEATARVAKEGFVVVSFPLRRSGSPGMDPSGRSELVVARFEWSGGSYQLKLVQHFQSYKWDGDEWVVVLTMK